MSGFAGTGAAGFLGKVLIGGVIGPGVDVSNGAMLDMTPNHGTLPGRRRHNRNIPGVRAGRSSNAQGRQHQAGKNRRRRFLPSLQVTRIYSFSALPRAWRFRSPCGPSTHAPPPPCPSIWPPPLTPSPGFARWAWLPSAAGSAVFRAQARQIRSANRRSRTRDFRSALESSPRGDSCIAEAPDKARLEVTASVVDPQHPLARSPGHDRYEQCPLHCRSYGRRSAAVRRNGLGVRYGDRRPGADGR